ncbi:MAG: 5'-nucleotidase C-terminal domain-containing protein [Bacteroidetes bacterium]|nr:5'-nucleotidase C-terminal domain-containing protein [Bacteroidota bacterium]
MQTNFNAMSKSLLKWLSYLFVLVVVSCKPTSSIQKVETTSYKFNQKETPPVDSTVYYSILPFKNKIDAEMNDVVCRSSMPFQKNQPEGDLGNLIADIIKEEAIRNYNGPDDYPISFSFFNNGGLRASLPEGDITVRNIFELLPFENEIAVLTLKGTTVKQLLDYISVKGGVPVSGLKMKIKDVKAIEVFIAGEALDENKTYKIVTNDYLANGGDNLEFMKDALRKEFPGTKVRDAVLKNLREKNKKGIIISSKIEGRIAYDK